MQCAPTLANVTHGTTHSQPHPHVMHGPKAAHYTEGAGTERACQHQTPSYGRSCIAIGLRDAAGSEWSALGNQHEYGRTTNVQRDRQTYERGLLLWRWGVVLCQRGGRTQGSAGDGLCHFGRGLRCRSLLLVGVEQLTYRLYDNNTHY